MAQGKNVAGSRITARLLHKRYTYADWTKTSGAPTLLPGELGLDITNNQVRIGVGTGTQGQSWNDAKIVSCRVVVEGTGTVVTGASYDGTKGELTLTLGNLSYNDLTDKPSFDASGAADAAVSAHNSSNAAHSDIRTAIGNNTTAINNEKSRAEGVEAELQAAIDVINGAATVAGSIKKAVADEATARGNADTALGQRIDGEASARESADNALGVRIGNVETRVGTAEGKIQTLEETVADHGTAISNLTSAKVERLVVTALPTSDIKTNVIYMMKRQDNTGAETSDIYDEYIYVNNKWEMIGNTAVDLTAYAKSADVKTTTDGLSTAISNEATARSEADADLQDAIDVINGTGAGSIKKAVGDEKTRAEAAEKTLTDNLAAEVSARESADTALGKRIDGVASDLATASSELDGAIDAEVDARTAADTALGGRIDGVVTNVTNLTTVVNTINGADTVTGSFKKAVKDEATARGNADIALSNRITVLEEQTHDYRGVNPITINAQVDSSTGASYKQITHAKPSADDLVTGTQGLYSFSIDEYGHVTAMDIVVILDGNAE